MNEDNINFIDEFGCNGENDSSLEFLVKMSIQNNQNQNCYENSHSTKETYEMTNKFLEKKRIRKKMRKKKRKIRKLLINKEKITHVKEIIEKK